MARVDLSLNRRQIVDSQKWFWFEQIGWHPHRYQIQAHQNIARERYTTAGRRGGKSEWAGHEASAYMVAAPFSVLLVGPIYDDVQNEFDVILRDVRHPNCPHEITRVIDNAQAGNLVIELSNGAKVVGKSTAQTSKSPIIGKEYDLLILCEGAKINNLGGDSGIWETQLRGNLMSRLGDLIVPTTPNGKDDWLYPRFLEGLSGKNPDRWSLQWPAWANPTFLEDVVKLRSEMSWRAFQEQVLGLFVSWSGSIWVEDCGFDKNKHVIPPFSIPSWYNRHEVIDPGHSGNFAWMASVIDEMGIRYIVDEFQVPKTRYKDLTVQILRHRALMYPPGKIPKNIPVYVDPSSPRTVHEISAEAMEMGEEIACLPADNNIMSGFEFGSRRFRSDSLFVFSTCNQIIDAFLYHEWGGNVNNKGKVEARDVYKHLSDTGRYSMLAPLHASIKPVEQTPGTWTYKELYDQTRGFVDGGFGMPFTQWRNTFGKTGNRLGI